MPAGEAMYAQVLTDIHHPRMERVFTYEIPPELESGIRRGVRVEVPFSGRIVPGYVVATGPDPGFSGRILRIRRILSGGVSLPEDLFRMAEWLARTSFVSLPRACSHVFPSLALRRRDQGEMQVQLTEAGRTAVEKLRRCPARQVLEAVSGPEQLTWGALSGVPGATPGVLRRIQGDGWIRLEPVSRVDPGVELPPLSASQQTVLEAIRREGTGPGSRPVLLQGVTGSGKTMLYFHLIRECLAQGRQALVLLPEIALTREMMRRFREVFGPQVLPWHSGLGGGQKKEIWETMLAGQASLLVGPRSAVFAGMRDLGLVIVDEEHDPGYRQETTPCYDAREAVLFRASLTGARVVFGSATPSLETLHRARQGVFARQELRERYHGAVLPRVRIVDMRQELREGNTGIFSRLLQAELGATLSEGKQALLFLNRRGFSGAFVCRDCGLAIECPRCEIALTYHRVGDLLKCHYCSHQQAATRRCPRCKSTRIRSFGTGTQQVEEQVKKLFPGANVVRMDGDTAPAREEIQPHLAALRDGTADILVGTQMVTKGLDFPKVRLAAVLAADLGLHMPDFRARERTCQQMIQVAGRTGRADTPGLCVIQTYSPEDPALVLAREGRYGEFAREELAYRERLGYPPFRECVRILLSGTREDPVREMAQVLCDTLERGPMDVLGPAPAVFRRIDGRYRWQLLVMGGDRDAMAEEIRKALETSADTAGRREVTVTVEPDPGSMQ